MPFFAEPTVNTFITVMKVALMAHKNVFARISHIAFIGKVTAFRIIASKTQCLKANIVHLLLGGLGNADRFISRYCIAPWLKQKDQSH